MQFIIDRFECEYAVVELADKSTVNIPRSLLPKDAQEGDIIEITVNKNETSKRKNNISKLMDDVWEK